MYLYLVTKAISKLIKKPKVIIKGTQLAKSSIIISAAANAGAKND